MDIPPPNSDPTSVTKEATGLLHVVSLSDQVHRVIRTRIITGELTAEEIYPISRFTAEWGVSASPVRDALQQLASEGLIEIVRNRGFRIRALSPHDLDEIAQLRLLLEVGSTVQIAALKPASSIDELRRLATAVEEAARQGDLTTWLDSDRTFHLTLLGLLGNRRLVDTVGRLRDQVRLYGLRALVEAGTLLSSTMEHTQILDAIERADQLETEKWMKQHLSHIRGVWAGQLENSDDTHDH